MSYALIFFRSDQEDAQPRVSGVFVFSQDAGTPASGHGARASVDRRDQDERDIEPEDEVEQEVEPEGLGEEDVAVENREDEDETQPGPEVEQKYLDLARLESRLHALEEHLERMGADNARAAVIKREILSLESQIKELLQE
jgi:ribosomal protein S15P/S13E